jgi:hypothetical protein
MEYYKKLDLESLHGEEWIDVIGFDGIYEVSNLGRVKSVGRYVQANGGGERWVRERILKQSMGDSSLVATLCVGGICKRFQVSRLVFFSFNYNKDCLPEYYVVHRDNNWKNNSLDNLKIGDMSEVLRLTTDSGKMSHLDRIRPKFSKHTLNTAKIKDGCIIEKKCICCNVFKKPNEFRHERNTCKSCVWEKERKIKGIKTRKCKGLKVVEIETGKVSYYKNYTDPDLLKIISTTTAIKHVRNKTVCKPYLKSQNFKPFTIQEI